MNVHKGMYSVFSTIYGSVLQVAVPKGKVVFYRNKVLKNLKSYFQNKLPKSGLKFKHARIQNFFLRGWVMGAGSNFRPAC